MRILLVAINAKYIHSNPAVYALQAYAKANLRQELLMKHEIEIREYTINQEYSDVLRDIYERQADYVCFSCYIWNIQMVERLIRDLHQITKARRSDDRKTSLWVGGPEVSFHPEELFESLPGLDGVFIGEGEESFTRFAEAVFTDQVPDKIAGIATRTCVRNERNYRDCNHLEREAAPENVQPYIPLDRVPFLYTEEHLETFRNRIIYYESSRGCPFRCSYCLSSIEKTVRYRSLPIVFKELEFFEKHRIRQVKFVDRTFNCDSKRALEIWNFIAAHDNGVTNFHFEIAADLVTEPELELLHTLRPGLVQLEIGVQTTNEETLREIRRPSSFEKIAYVSKRIREGRNIHLHLDLIAGLPYEDLESFHRSFNDVYGLRPDELQLGFLKVLKGSYMEERARDYELVYSDYPPYEVMSTKWLSYEDIILLKAVEEMLEVYYNSGLFTVSMQVLLQRYEADPYSMYLDLARFYKKMGYDRVSHNRIARIEILAQFVKEQFGEDSMLYFQMKQALIFDLYHHENAKSRPVFAPSLTENKEIYKSFYMEEERMGRPNLPEEAYQNMPSKTMANVTHLEAFDWDFTQEEWKKKPCWILFSYETKDPIVGNGQARVVMEQ